MNNKEVYIVYPEIRNILTIFRHNLLSFDNTALAKDSKSCVNRKHPE